MTNLKLISILLLLFIAACLIFVVGAVTVRAEETVIDMSNFREGDLLVDGFELKAQTRLSIRAVGAALKAADEMYAYGWIINGETREPVWVLNEQETSRLGVSRTFREFDGEVTLPAGKYECYYYAGQPYSLVDLNLNINDLGDAIEVLGSALGGEKESKRIYYSEDLDKLAFVIKAPAGSFAKFNPVTKMHEDAIIDFSEPGDDFSVKKGFTLKKEMPLKITAIGEYSSNDRVFVDYGWVIDASTRKKVWQMDKWNTSWVGGGRKNRGFNESVTLPAGDYIAYYVTDDSHSFEEWNTLPPYDPLHYGLVIYPKNAADKPYAILYQDTYTEPVVINLTKIRNDEFVSKGFSLKKTTDLHIIAIGEYGYSDEFVDFGWIENVDSNVKVWEMTEENTEHAGGASKNRKFDGIVTFPPGNYMVYYVSDDSHAYRDWNATAPIDKEMWGIAIYGAGKNFDVKSISLFDDAPLNSKILVNLTGIGDDRDVERTFKLTSREKIHIYALGEGTGGEMFDYGWIEDNHNGDVVWEMTYRRTRHAGGADKNREADTYITLDPGEYTAHYVTDGSHSFPDFNAPHPDNPQKWGITVTKE